MQKRKIYKNEGPGLKQKTWSAEAPTKEKSSSDSAYFNYKAYRDLQNTGNIEVKADPTSDAVKGSYPYYIINKTNKVVDANYVGIDNIDGNALTRLQNSNESKLLNEFDLVQVNKRINYLYLCYKTDADSNRNNLAANLEMVKAFEEAASKGYSTMLTQLPFFTQTVVTDLPEIPGLNNTTAQNYQKLGALLHYQTVLQNACAPLSKYIQLRSLEQQLMNMSYRRESQLVTQLFGQLKKAAFIAQLKAIGTSIIGEYFDANWYKQMNTIMFMASRKSNSITDPLETSNMTTAIPLCKMKSLGADNFYYNSDVHLRVAGSFVSPETFEIESELNITFEEAIRRLVKFLDPVTILGWARDINVGLTFDIMTPSAYYEQCIVKLVNAINLTLTRFSTYMSEVRTFIDKLDDTGLVYWKKGMFVDVSNISDLSPDYNKILSDLIASEVGGSGAMVYDNNTQRWQCWSLWDKYEGIPYFDKKSGGAFLTLGLRKLSRPQGMADTDIAMCVPILFAPPLINQTTQTAYPTVVATNRLGLDIEISSTIKSVNTDPVLSRLDPLNIGFEVKIPHVTVNLGSVSARAANSQASAIGRLLTNIAGYGNTTVDYIDPDDGQTFLNTSQANPDSLCFVDVQIDDLSNEMIQFCRNYSPFRVSTPNGARTVGLGNTK